jgi:tRNA threonylcarbamoyladenosine biosynthesis protein TsaE
VPTVTVASPDATERLGQRVAAHLRAGDVLCLHGDLAAGKTTFVRGLARGLGSPSPVSSPTFTLIHEYPGGRLPLVHMDAYRLSGPDDAESTGILDYLADGRSVVAIEWAQRIAAALPDERLEITLADGGADGRCVRFDGHGARWDTALPW